MSIRFSRDGPAFPEPLVDALLRGEVVFLCGAGISAPQLPGFEGLVRQCFGQLNVGMSPSESLSFTQRRYEEALGSLSRRIVNPAEMVQTVVQLLQPPLSLDLDHHRTILRLSRDRDNLPTVVTTNFDTLLEKALLESDTAVQVRGLSRAGQDIPPPGSAGFGGIIHLHGRIADQGLELEETPLVITSADYGDAYMRSGWASRFLFDLCRCKTIVLVGYSAGDAPVRYFLNVLEADRLRFPDLRPVYALDAVDLRAEADVRWEALAVEPIVYEYDVNSETGAKSHNALWRDLKRLADVVERPRATRYRWARELLHRPFESMEVAELDRVAWLLGGRRNLWPVAIAVIEDEAWLEFFADRQLWRDSDGAWIVSAWIARDFQSSARFHYAIGWMERLGKPFADEIARRLQQAKDVPILWLRAWRLLLLSQPGCDSEKSGQRFYAMQQVLKGPVVLNADLHSAVGMLVPELELSANDHEGLDGTKSEMPEKLHQLAFPRLRVRDFHGAADLLESLVAVAQPVVIMSIATARLQEVVGLSVDIHATEDDYDSNDFSVPSIEPHPQNDHHGGPILLVQLLARLMLITGEKDRPAVRGLAQAWRAMPGMLGIRLWLHALRNPILFSADEAISAMNALPLNFFWNARREFALALRERATQATRSLTLRVEKRILTEGDDYFARYLIDDGQADWRPHARDTEVWLRLHMLRAADTLSDVGAAELAAIIERRDYLRRDVEDSDFFGSYVTGVRAVVGDAQPIIDASEGDRLQVAQDVIRSADIEKQQGWSLYCRTDPNGALDTLLSADLDVANAPLWATLIGSLSFLEGDKSSSRHELVTRIFASLEKASYPFLALIARNLAALYLSAPRRLVPAISCWWPRLFRAAVISDTRPLNPGRKIYSDAINSPGGRLTQAALLDIEALRQGSERVEHALLDAITEAAAADGRQGAYARAVLVHAAGFVVTIEGQQVTERLERALAQETAEASALRAVLVCESRLSAEASRTFSSHILRGVIELGSTGYPATVAAAKIIAPALAVVRGETNAARWGITVTDTRRALREGPPLLREGAAALLKQWIVQMEGGAAAAWRTAIGPLFAQVWPRERALREVGLTQHLADLVISAGEAFPEALRQVLPYLGAFETRGGTYAIEKSAAPEQFPEETLTLLWKLFGNDSSNDIESLAKVLDRLVMARPAIELDRRLQALDQRAVRYE